MKIFFHPKYIKHIAITLCFIFLCAPLIAQDITTLKTALSYNFAKFTQWQKDDEPETIWQLCYLGEQYQSSFNMLSEKKLSGKKIAVIQLNDLNGLEPCHLIYIDSEYRYLLPRLFLALKNTTTLTISDTTGFVDMGGMIEIVPSLNARLQFKVNPKSLEESRLTLSSKVLKLALEIKN